MLGAIFSPVLQPKSFMPRRRCGTCARVLPINTHPGWQLARPRHVRLVDTGLSGQGLLARRACRLVSRRRTCATSRLLTSPPRFAASEDVGRRCRWSRSFPNFGRSASWCSAAAPAGQVAFGAPEGRRHRPSGRRGVRQRPRKDGHELRRRRGRAISSTCPRSYDHIVIASLRPGRHRRATDAFGLVGQARLSRSGSTDDVAPPIQQGAA